MKNISSISLSDSSMGLANLYAEESTEMAEFFTKTLKVTLLGFKT